MSAAKGEPGIRTHEPCSGSGKKVPREQAGEGRYRRCPDCNASVKVSSERSIVPRHNIVIWPEAAEEEIIASLLAENGRLMRGLEAVQEIGCGIPGHAVAVGCERALAAQAVLGGWEPKLWRGSCDPEARDYAQRWVDQENAARAGLPEGPRAESEKT